MKGKWMKIVRQYTIITLGISMMAVGVYFFKFPNNFSIGGVSGLSQPITFLFRQLALCHEHGFFCDGLPCPDGLPGCPWAEEFLYRRVC